MDTKVDTIGRQSSMNDDHHVTGSYVNPVTMMHHAMNQLCKVCGEPAAGFHFGAFTCEGCKSFFGRTYNNLSSLSECKNNGRCVINKKNRTSCKSCRLRKCLMVGMSKSGSRYGRRSNWFKIHCLLQDQATLNGQLHEAALNGFAGTGGSGRDGGSITGKLGYEADGPPSSPPTSKESSEPAASPDLREDDDHHVHHHVHHRTHSGSYFHPHHHHNHHGNHHSTTPSARRHHHHHHQHHNHHNHNGGLPSPFSPSYDSPSPPSSSTSSSTSEHHVKKELVHPPLATTTTTTSTTTPHLPISPISPLSPPGTKFLFAPSPYHLYPKYLNAYRPYLPLMPAGMDLLLKTEPKVVVLTAPEQQDPIDLSVKRTGSPELMMTGEDDDEDDAGDGVSRGGASDDDDDEGRRMSDDDGDELMMTDGESKKSKNAPPETPLDLTVKN